MTHSTQGICNGCLQKLGQCDPFWIEWFRQVFIKWPNAHIAWGFRGQADQEADFAAGKSMLNWPNSKHNFMLGDGQPNSLALDLFQIDQYGKAIFDPKWCSEVFTWSLAQGFPVQWGGNFQHLKDMDHFEISEPSQF